jgi:hypothetical protein
LDPLGLDPLGFPASERDVFQELGMRVFGALALALTLSISSYFALTPAFAQIDVVISVDVAPPPLPVYEQPPIPAVGYLWVPGYWAWDDDTGYYWVPGTWVLPPEPGLLWTPGYWGWDDGYYGFHEGYWGPHIGFYGGVAYGFGYDGVGYEGGYWRDGAFFYNRTVNNFANVTVVNVYSKTVVINNRTNVSFNGGAGGTTVRPTSEQLEVARERHVAATGDQTRHAQEASKDPGLSLASNHGHPTVAATTRAATFKGPGVIAAQPGQPIAAISPQGHSKERKGPAGGTTTTPGTATPSTTTPGTTTTTREHKGPAGGTTTTPGTTTPSTTTPGSTTTGRERKGTIGGTTTTPGTTTPGTTTPGSTTTGREFRERKGTGGTGTGGSSTGGSSTSGASTSQSKKFQPTETRPTTRAAPPPPPPPRAPPPPPPRGKPKCEPGQKCN